MKDYSERTDFRLTRSKFMRQLAGPASSTTVLRPSKTSAACQMNLMFDQLLIITHCRKMYIISLFHRSMRQQKTKKISHNNSVNHVK